MEKISIPNDLLFNQVSSLLDSGSDVVIPTKGNSMLPFIHGEKDRAVLRKTADVKKGDIVLAFVEGDRYVLHRIWSIDGDLIRLMGDGNLVGKEECSLADIKGTLIEIIRPDGKKIDVNGRGFKFKSRIWLILLPVRRYILAIIKRINIKH